MTRNPVLLLLPILLLSACSTLLEEGHNYQPLGTAVLTANDLLIAEYPEGPPANFSSDDYKDLLKKDYHVMYDRLQPYQIKVEHRGNNFIVDLYDSGRLIMKDASCSETRIDCWVYKQECDPTTFHVPCLEPNH
jgi:hypothetical protein